MTTLQCHKCGHRWVSSCVSYTFCPNCRTYVSKSTAAILAQQTGLRPAADPDAGLGPAVRDNAGQPLPPPKPEPRASRPEAVVNDFEFIRRREAQIAAERQRELSKKPIEETGT